MSDCGKGASLWKQVLGWGAFGIVAVWLLAGSLNGPYGFYQDSPGFQLYPTCIAVLLVLVFVAGWIVRRCNCPWIFMMVAVLWVPFFVFITKEVDRKEVRMHPLPPRFALVLSSLEHGVPLVVTNEIGTGSTEVVIFPSEGRTNMQVQFELSNLSSNQTIRLIEAHILFKDLGGIFFPTVNGRSWKLSPRPFPDLLYASQNSLIPLGSETLPMLGFHVNPEINFARFVIVKARAENVSTQIWELFLFFPGKLQPWYKPQVILSNDMANAAFTNLTNIIRMPVTNR